VVFPRSPVIAVDAPLAVKVSDRTPYVPAVPKEGVVAANKVVGPPIPNEKMTATAVVAIPPFINIFIYLFL
jgi:hypothetical protein